MYIFGGYPTLKVYQGLIYREWLIKHRYSIKHRSWISAAPLLKII